MTNFRSIAGGFFSSDPNNKSEKVSIRCNNPGALNVAPWIRSYPGYVSDYITTPGNSTVVFETPENGVAAWYELMRKYRDNGATTVKQIIMRYGGSGQNYTDYYKQVAAWTGLPENLEIKLKDDDLTLLLFAKAMFRYEAGVTIPWSNAQIMTGFALGRGTPVVPVPQPVLVPQPVPVPAPHPVLVPQPVPVPIPSPAPPPAPPPPVLPWWTQLLNWLAKLFGKSAKAPLPFTRILRKGMQGDDVRQLQQRLLNSGYTDLVIDGMFGAVTETAVRAFQLAHNLDPDGLVGDLTLDALNTPNAAIAKPPLLPPVGVASAPPWYNEAVKWIGFHEVGTNRGIEKFIAGGKCGTLGDPWCAIFENFVLETTGFQGTRSAMARSFESNPRYVKLMGPALGAITTMWRVAPKDGQGHVFLYDGENAKGVRGIGANELDSIKRSMHDRARIVGYYWPRDYPLPMIKPIIVTDAGGVAGSET